MDYEAVCQFDDLPDSEGRFFMVKDQPIGLFRIGSDVFAIDDRCPHAGASLSRGYVEGGIVRCRIHHWGFRVCDGRYVDQDEVCHNAHSFPVRVVDGEVQVAINR